MNYLFITTQDKYYKQGVELRISLFFDGMENALQLINDEFEDSSIHLVCLNKSEDVVGTGRLTIKNNTGIVSQMAIDKTCQHQGIGKKIMELLMEKCLGQNIKEIRLSARKTAIGFYEKFGFKAIGEFYPSKKTGIIHQEMVKLF